MKHRLVVTPDNFYSLPSIASVYPGDNGLFYCKISQTSEDLATCANVLSAYLAYFSNSLPATLV